MVKVPASSIVAARFGGGMAAGTFPGSPARLAVAFRTGLPM